MAYVLEALIVRGAPEWPEPVTRLARLVPLRSPDGLPLGLVPLTEDVRSRLGVDSASAPVLGFLELRRPVADLAAEASLSASVAYVHAGFSGGPGFQAAVGWRAGKIAFGPRFTTNHGSRLWQWLWNRRYQVIRGKRPSGAPAAMAIDEALQFLGVEAVGDLDEFDTVGLGAHRLTEDWLGPRKRGRSR
jgi:hypothetical protein